MLNPATFHRHPSLRASLQSLGTCVGLLGWADGLIVTTWRQWEGLMRNICFCVSTEPLIVQGKGYSTPIQIHHNENPSPPWAGWAYNIHPLLFPPLFFFFPTPLLDFNSPRVHFAYCTYVTRFVPADWRTMACETLSSEEKSAERHKANMKAAEISIDISSYTLKSSLRWQMPLTDKLSNPLIHRKKKTLSLHCPKLISTFLWHAMWLSWRK